MSDLHLEFEDDHYWSVIEQRARRGDASAAELWDRRHQLLATPSHPRRGPDLRGLASGEIDLLLLPGDIDVGKAGAAYANEAALYLDVPRPARGLRLLRSCRRSRLALEGVVGWRREITGVVPQLSRLAIIAAAAASGFAALEAMV